MSRNGSLKTDDLALATTLILRGYSYTLARGVKEVDGRSRRTCFWIFPNEDGIRRLVDNYHQGKISVEPKRFVLTWGVVRREMMEFLD